MSLLVLEGIWGFSDVHTLISMLTGSLPPTWTVLGAEGMQKDRGEQSCPRDLLSTYTTSRMRTSQFLVLVGKNLWANESQT